MSKKLEDLSDKDLEKRVSVRDKELRAIAKFALNVLEKVGNQRDVLDYFIKNFHGFDIHYKNWGDASRVTPIGATTSLYISYGSVGGLTMEYKGKKTYFPCNDKVLQAIIYYRDDGEPVQVDPYNKGPWENELKKLMANPSEAIETYLKAKEAEALKKKPKAPEIKKIDRAHLLHRAKYLKIN